MSDKNYPDCGDNSCMFVPDEHRGGMRTNGGCSCISGSNKKQAHHDGQAIALYWKARAEKMKNCINCSHSTTDYTEAECFPFAVIECELPGKDTVDCLTSGNLYCDDWEQE